MTATALPATLQDRVLVLMPSLRDTERTVQVLAEARIACAPSATVEELGDQLRAGAGALLVTDEILTADARRPISDFLLAQPAWFALPVLVLAREGTGERIQDRVLDGYGNVVVLERPVRTRSLVSAVHSALRARRTQYQIRDAVEDRERQAMAILEQDEKLRFVLAAGCLGAWEIAPDEGEFVCSDITKEIYGRPLDRPFTFTELRDCIPREDHAHVFEALAACVDTGAAYDVEHRVLWPNGETRWVLSRGRAAQDRATSVTRVVGVSLDVTERERLHQELALASRAKDEFLATLSHELRTPLGSILGWATILRRKVRDDSIEHGLDVIERNAKLQERLISDLLDVSRIICGKLRLALAKTTLSDAVQRAAEAVRPAAESKGVQLIVEMDRDLPAFVADADRLQQVVWNLLANAVRFTPGGGRVAVRAHRIDSTLLVQVADTGSGIAAEHLPHLFERFRQVDSSTTRRHGGLGLGLAIVRHIVEAHGGSVEVESPGLGRGSTFTLALPIRAIDTSERDVDEVVETPAMTAPVQRTSLEGMRILVVEDDADSLDLIRRLLVEVGANVATAGSATDALAARGPFDVILSDIGMPEMDGYALMKRMRSRDVGADVPAIALTAYARAEDGERAMRAGYQEHLPKPIEPSKLVTALARWRPRKTTTVPPPG